MIERDKIIQKLRKNLLKKIVNEKIEILEDVEYE